MIATNKKIDKMIESKIKMGLEKRIEKSADRKMKVSYVCDAIPIVELISSRSGAFPTPDITFGFSTKRIFIWYKPDYEVEKILNGITPESSPKLSRKTLVRMTMGYLKMVSELHASGNKMPEIRTSKKLVDVLMNMECVSRFHSMTCIKTIVKYEKNVLYRNGMDDSIVSEAYDNLCINEVCSG